MTILRVLALLLLTTPVWAKEVPVTPGLGTLATAIAGAAPGDVLILKGGAYLGPVTIDRSLTLQGDVAISKQPEADLRASGKTKAE